MSSLHCYFRESNTSEKSIANTNAFSKYLSLPSMNGFGSFFQECQTFTYPTNDSEWIPLASFFNVEIIHITFYHCFSLWF